MHKARAGKIKTQIRILVYTIVVACLLVVMLCAATTYGFLQSANAFFSASRELTDFYLHADAMNRAAIDYLLRPTEELLITYQNEKELAYGNIQRASGYLDESAAWRLGRLSNMLLSYDEEFQSVDRSEYFAYTSYLQFRYLGELIQNTSDDYHTILRNFMESRNDRTQSSWRIQAAFSLAVVTTVLFVGFFSTQYFERRISLPIAQMVKNVKLVQQGKYELYPVKNASAELNILTNAFSVMASSLQNNVERLRYNAQVEMLLLAQEHKTLQMQKDLVQAELNHLQTQINPHFLFNTLNLISKKAFLHGDQEICDLMENTAALLRYSLDKANKISTLHEELQCIQNYFEIQQSRFEGRITFALKSDPNIPQVAMPAMVLQPLVENSVMHGIRDMTEGAEVRLGAHCEGQCIRICIEDNGVGIPSEKLEKLMEDVVGKPVLFSDDMDMEHIGLRNVYRRLKMYYGDEMKFSIESEEECGCNVVIEIPLDME